MRVLCEVKWLCHLRSDGKLSTADVKVAMPLFALHVEGQPDVRCCPLLSAVVKVAMPLFASHVDGQPDLRACLLRCDRKLSAADVSHVKVGLPDLCACCVGQRREVVVKVAMPLFAAVGGLPVLRACLLRCDGLLSKWVCLFYTRTINHW